MTDSENIASFLELEEEVALQSIFDDIFNVPSTNFLLNGKEPVLEFTAIPHWTSPKVLTTITSLINDDNPFVRGNKNCRLLDILLIMAVRHSELLYDKACIDEFHSILLSIKNNKKFTIQSQLLSMVCLTYMAQTSFLSDKLTVAKEMTNNEWLNRLEKLNTEEPDDTVTPVLFAELLKLEIPDILKSIKLRWSQREYQHEVQSVLKELFYSSTIINSTNVTNLFGDSIATFDSLGLLLNCHLHISPPQMYIVVETLLRLLKKNTSMIYDRDSIDNIFRLFYDAIHCSDLRRSKLDFHEKSKPLSGKDSIDILVSFPDKCHLYFKASPWHSISPTFTAFLKKSLVSKKNWMFFRTLKEEATGIILKYQSQCDKRIDDLNIWTTRSLAVLSKISQLFENDRITSSKKKNSSAFSKMPHIIMTELFCLSLCAFGQAVFGEQFSLQQHDLTLSKTSISEELLNPCDSLLFTQFSRGENDYKLVNQIIEESNQSASKETHPSNRANQSANKGYQFSLESGLAAVIRNRLYKLNRKCPSPALLFMALKDVTLSGNRRSAFEANQLISSNISAFSKMSSLMLARATSEEIETIFHYLSFFNGQQLIAIIEPYIEIFTKKEPAVLGRFLAKNLITEFKDSIDSLTKEAPDNQTTELNLYLAYCNQIVLTN